MYLMCSTSQCFTCGSVPVEASQSVVTDIDPLAKSPPKNIISWTEGEAKSAVYKPVNLSASLAEAIGSGKAQECMNDLMRRIADFGNQIAAAEIKGRVADAATLSEADREKLFSDIVSSEAQRVFRLMRYAAEDLDTRARNPAERAMADFFELATALDPASANGLTEEASRSLVLASEALKKQLLEDFDAGILDQHRLQMLMGGGPGAHTVATAIIQRLLMSFPDR
jgi:hypothetical protein